jgi:hypothetical protein
MPFVPRGAPRRATRRLKFVDLPYTGFKMIFFLIF